MRRHALLVLLEGGDVVDAAGEVVEVCPSADHPSWAVRGREVGGEVRVRQDDRVAEADATAAVLPPRVGLDEGAEGVLAVAGLLDRPDPAGPVPASRPPSTLPVDRHAAALDLDDDDAHLWHEDEDVELVVLLRARQPQVRDENRVLVNLSGEPVPDEPLRVVRELVPLIRLPVHSALPAAHTRHPSHDWTDPQGNRFPHGRFRRVHAVWT